MVERLRWRLALLVSRLVKRSCWASLGCWAVWNDRGQLTEGRWRQGPSCIGDAERNGSCWCGKVRYRDAEYPERAPGFVLGYVEGWNDAKAGRQYGEGRHGMRHVGDDGHEGSPSDG